MPNSIMGANPPQQAQNGMPINANMLQQFQQFKQTFNGNPKQQVMQMLSQGKVGNAQVQQAMQMARQLQGLLK